MVSGKGHGAYSRQYALHGCEKKSKKRSFRVGVSRRNEADKMEGRLGARLWKSVGGSIQAGRGQFPSDGNS